MYEKGIRTFFINKKTKEAAFRTGIYFYRPNNDRELGEGSKIGFTRINSNNGS